MKDFKRKIMDSIMGLLFIFLTWGISTIWNKTENNTSFNIKHQNSINTLKERIDTLEKNYSNMPDTYVTRRELNIILGSIDAKVDSIGTDVKDMNVKFDRMLEKIYEKK